MQALMFYRLDNQSYPIVEQGLNILVIKSTAGFVPLNWKTYIDKLQRPMGLSLPMHEPWREGRNRCVVPGDRRPIRWRRQKYRSRQLAIKFVTRYSAIMQRQRGFTLIELLVVLAIIGLGFAAVSLSLRDSGQTQLQREAQRLVAVLEAARAQSRTTGVPLVCQITAEGFVIRSAQKRTPLQAVLHTNNLAIQEAGHLNAPDPLAIRTETWLAADRQTRISADVRSANSKVQPNAVVLGPEPILSPVHITLHMSTKDGTQSAPGLRIGTNGLQPFHVEP